MRDYCPSSHPCLLFRRCPISTKIQPSFPLHIPHSQLHWARALSLTSMARWMIVPLGRKHTDNLGKLCLKIDAAEKQTNVVSRLGTIVVPESFLKLLRSITETLYAHRKDENHPDERSKERCDIRSLIYPVGHTLRWIIYI